MFGTTIKWTRIFSSRRELEGLFALRDCVVHRSMFGEVLFVRKDNEILAFRNRCPHQGKSMEGSWVEGDKLVCPVHQYHFSLENGRGHGLCVDKYELRYEENGVYLGKETWSLFGK